MPIWLRKFTYNTISEHLNKVNNTAPDLPELSQIHRLGGANPNASYQTKVSPKK
jgi:hypothetical protein